MLHKLPPEILYTILCQLSAADVGQLALCNRTFHAIAQDDILWKHMFRYRFPKQYASFLSQKCVDPSNSRWKHLYRSKDLLRLSAVHDVNITDIKLPYWKVQETSESVYGVTAKLHSIRLLDLRGTFEGVLPGRYRVQWRIKLSLAARWNEPLDFTVDLKGNATAPIVCTTPQGFYNRNDVVTESWIIITLPREIVIENSWGPTDVQVSHEKRTRLWKAGMEIDWVRLVPAESLKDSSTTTFHDGFGIDHESRSQRTSSSSVAIAVTKSTVMAKLSWIIDMTRAIAVLSGFIWSSTLFKKSSSLY